jgi:hypothetical protein
VAAPEAASARLDFAIVGAQRSGSTQLSACLQEHPEIFLCPDEVPYFENPFFPNTAPSALTPVFGGARAGQRRGIHCPSYLCRIEVTDRLHAYAPDARILMVLRDPVARAVSAYYWYVQYGMLPLIPAEAGLGRLLDGWSDPDYLQADEVLGWSVYAPHVERYLARFGPDQVLVLMNDDLDDPEMYPRLFEFVGVSSEHVPAPRQARANSGVYDPRRLRWLRTRQRLAWSWAETNEYRYRPRRLRKPVRFALNAAVVGIDRVVLARLFGNRAAPLSSELQARLRAHFADDVRQLESVLGRDLVGWRPAMTDG